jgi:hypothetical protein
MPQKKKTRRMPLPGRTPFGQDRIDANGGCQYSIRCQGTRRAMSPTGRKELVRYLCVKWNTLRNEPVEFEGFFLRTRNSITWRCIGGIRDRYCETEFRVLTYSRQLNFSPRRRCVPSIWNTSGAPCTAKRLREIALSLPFLAEHAPDPSSSSVKGFLLRPNERNPRVLNGADGQSPKFNRFPFAVNLPGIQSVERLSSTSQ